LRRSPKSPRWAIAYKFPAKQATTRCDSPLFARPLQVTDPAGIAALYEGLDKLNPKSQYIPMAGPRYFIALLQQKDLAKAQTFAESAAANNQANEDMLLFIADANLNAKNYDKAITYSNQLTTMLPAMAAPQGVAPADWDTKKKNTLARGHWIAGMAAGAKSDWLNTDKFMRAALPLVEGNPPLKDLLPAAYFYLGLSNYTLSKGAKPDAARRADARKYFTACSAIPGPYQNQAIKNLNAMTAGK